MRFQVGFAILILITNASFQASAGIRRWSKGEECIEKLQKTNILPSATNSGFKILSYNDGRDFAMVNMKGDNVIVSTTSGESKVATGSRSCATSAEPKFVDALSNSIHHGLSTYNDFPSLKSLEKTNAMKEALKYCAENMPGLQEKISGVIDKPDEYKADRAADGKKD